MIIKKYIGKTEDEAAELARKELGGGIVIMNVKPVKKSGLLSIFAPKKVEVTVALEEDSSRRAPYGPNDDRRVVKPKKHDSDESLSSNKKSKADSRRSSDISSEFDVRVGDDEPDPDSANDEGAAFMADIARAASEGKIPPLKLGKAAQVKEAKEEGAANESKSDVNAIEAKLDNLHSLLEQRIATPVSSDPVPMTAMEKLSGKKPKIEEDDTTIPKEILSFIKLLYNTLLENEVDEIYANELTDEIEKVAKKNISLDNALVAVYQKMVLKFGRSEIIQPAQDGAKALVFIGPTGVGKTTTIAKLASKLRIEEKKKVALITVDTYRIAAAEQLRTYAAIMETPFRVVYSVEEMEQAVNDFRDYDYIMVDTAGHSVRNEEQKTNIMNFIKALSQKLESDNYLVLSATTKYRDLIEITDEYSALVKYKLLFTKMDETLANGNLYNIRMKTGAAMSYITNGQDVPDDIEVFDAQKIVKVLLGGRH